MKDTDDSMGHSKAESIGRDHRESAEPEPALSRWRARLRPTPAKAGLRETTMDQRPERPRTVDEAAEELGLSVHTIRAWVADRRIAHLRLGRAIRIPAAEIR